MKNWGFFIKLEFLGQFFQNYEKHEHFNVLVHASLMSMHHVDFEDCIYTMFNLSLMQSALGFVFCFGDYVQLDKIG